MNVKRTLAEGAKTMTHAEWLNEGKRRFGEYVENYKFKCPKCGNVASGQEFKDAGCEPGAMAQECIGRYVKGKGCDWAAYGFFDICTLHISDLDNAPVFEYADE